MARPPTTRSAAGPSNGRRRPKPSPRKLRLSQTPHAGVRDYGADPGGSANVMMVSVAITVTYCRPFTA